MSHTSSPSSAAVGGTARRGFLTRLTIISTLGGLLFGYDTGVISGAELFLKNDFVLSTFALELVVSGVLAGAAIGSCWSTPR